MTHNVHQTLTDSAMKENIGEEKRPRIPLILTWLFPYKRKGLSIPTKSTVSYYLFQNKISLVLINWIFQGMRGMGKADLIMKVFWEIILFCVCIILLNGSMLYRIVISLCIAHTISWLLNAHFWDLGRFIGITRTSPNKFFPYLRNVQKSVETTDLIIAAIVIGGVSRNAGFRETSDVDMIFIKKEGFQYALLSALIVERERVKAFFSKFPLHLELYDTVQSIKHRPDEVPILLKDSGALVKDWYEKTGRRTASLKDYDIMD